MDGWGANGLFLGVTLSPQKGRPRHLDNTDGRDYPFPDIVNGYKSFDYKFEDVTDKVRITSVLLNSLRMLSYSISLSLSQIIY